MQSPSFQAMDQRKQITGAIGGVVIMLSRLFSLFVALPIWFAASLGQAQSNGDVYVRIEASSTLTEAETRLRDYANAGLEPLNGFRLGGSWYGIALGPYADETTARATLRSLRAAGRIPSDSFLADRDEMGARFWPAGGGAALPASGTNPEPADGSVTEALTEGEPEVEPETVATPATPVETRAEQLARAREAEAALDRDARRVLQSRLQWAGFYNSTIDGLFGRGTRAAISAWQEARGFEPLGVMLPEHIDQLEQEYFAVFDGLGLREVVHAEAGVTLALPMAVLGEAQIEPPFVTYEPSGDLPVTAVIISQAGGRDRLAALYQSLQSLEIIPLQGPRTLTGDRFEITGSDRRRIAHAEAATADGEIKGFILVWPTGDEERRTRVIERLQESFATSPGTLGERAAVAWSGREALLSGLAVRQPARTGSGSFVSADGTVLTAARLVDTCERVTLGNDHALRVAARSEDGLALLTSDDGPLAPMAVLSLGAEVTAPTEIAVAGFSFGGRLNAASVTFGQLAEQGGLDGETGVIRLQLKAAESDAGGPVLGRDGQFAGVLLPEDVSGERMLPEQVRFAADRDSVVAFLAAQELSLPANAAPIEDLVGLRDYAQKITAQISCWE